MEIKFEKCHPDAKLPVYKHKGDAGMDVYAVENDLIKPGEWKIVPTGLKVAIPEGMEMQVRARSGFSAKYGIGLVNGVGTIDSGYRGEIGAILINHGHEDFIIEKGDRICQFVFSNYVEVTPIEATLDETERSSGGYGSSGRK